MQSAKSIQLISKQLSSEHDARFYKMSLRLVPGSVFRERRGLLYVFGWSGTEPTVFLRLAGQSAGRIHGITLSNAWRWRTTSESRNGEDINVTMHAACKVLEWLGADLSDPNQATRQAISLIGTIQHAIPELIKMPDLDMLNPSDLGLSTEADPLFTISASINGQKISEKHYTQAQVEFEEGMNV